MTHLTQRQVDAVTSEEDAEWRIIAIGEHPHKAELTCVFGNAAVRLLDLETYRTLKGQFTISPDGREIYTHPFPDCGDHIVIPSKWFYGHSVDALDGQSITIGHS